MKFNLHKEKMKQQAAKGDAGGADIPDFKELRKEELGKLSMPE